MKKYFDEYLMGVSNIDEAEEKTLNLLQKIKIKNGRLGFVSGMIFSDGSLYVKKNLNILGEFAEEIKRVNKFPIFSGLDIFYSGLFEKLAESKWEYSKRRKRFFKFWASVIRSGYITDIFMIPKWEKSEGSKDEYKNAKEMKMTIHFLEDNAFSTVALILIKDRKLLLVRPRRKKVFYMPGGKNDGDEKDSEALTREIEEELSVKITSDSLKYFNSYKAQAYGKKEGSSVRINCYTGKIEGRVKESSEIEEIKYFTLEEYLNTKEVAPAVKLILKDLKSKKIID